jgi:hypothetical protein
MIANALRREARKALTNAARNNGGHSMVRLFFSLSPLFFFFVFLGTRDDDIFFLSLSSPEERARSFIDRSIDADPKNDVTLSLSLSLFH